MNKIIIGIIGVIVGLVGGFYSGTAYQKKKIPTFAGNFMPGIGNANRDQTTARRTSGGPGGAVTGTVESKDDTSITVKTPTGSTQTVYYSGSTTFSHDATASASDVTVGENVMVSGEPNANNSVTAKTIRIVPAQ